MAIKRPTEADLGIEQTPEEVEILSRPVISAPDDDDIRSDDEDDALVVAAPKPEVVAETPEAKATRERDEAGKFKPKDGKPPEGFTDVRALQEARAENKVLNERMNTLLEIVQRREAKAAQAEAPPAPVIPDRATDPLGYIAYMDERLGKFEQESASQKQAREAEEVETREFQKALAVAKPQFDQAAAADPTMAPTYNALLESFAKEIAYLNRNDAAFIADPRGFVGKELSRLENGHIRFAVGSGENVVDYFKGLAASRGITGVPAAQVAAQPDPKPIAERIAAQDRHMSIGDLPGSAAPAQVSAKDLAKMTPKQFAEFARRVGDDGLDSIMGKA